MSKPDMVLLNGWAHPPEALRPLANYLANSFRVHVAPADDFPSPHFLLGWSLGGMRAIESAAKNPALISGLILIGSTARFTCTDGYPPGVPEQNVRAMILNLRRKPDRTLVQFFRDSAHPAVVGSDDMAVKVESAIHLGIDVLCDELRYLQISDWREAIKKVNIPALVLHGREDRVIPWQAGRWLSEQLSPCRWKIFDGAGHDLPVREPHLVADEIRRFVSL